MAAESHLAAPAAASTPVTQNDCPQRPAGLLRSWTLQQAVCDLFVTASASLFTEELCLLSLLFRITNAKNVLKIKSQKYDLEENNEIWNEEVTADNLDIQAKILWVLLQTCARMFAVLKPSCYFYP